MLLAIVLWLRLEKTKTLEWYFNRAQVLFGPTLLQTLATRQLGIRPLKQQIMNSAKVHTA